jgi:dihydroflavonol-4-reductase
MRVLVTGATGHLGSFVVRALLEQGHQVRALVRDPARLERAGLGDVLDRIDAVRGDVGDPASVRSAMADQEAVVHAAAQVALRKKDEAAARAVNVGGTETVLAEAAAAGLDPIVHVSSLVAIFPPQGPMLEADDEPTHPQQPYSSSKADAHRVAVAAQGRDEPVTIFTLGGVWGPGPGQNPLTEQLAAAIALLKVGVPVSKTGGMPVLDVRDAAAGVAAAVQPGQGPRRFLLGGRLVPTAELADVISTAIGKKVLRYPAPARAVVFTGALFDQIMKVLPVTLPITKEGMEILTGMVPADDGPTVAALGLQQHPTQQTIDDSYRWLVQHGHLKASRAPRWAGDRVAGGRSVPPGAGGSPEPGAASDEDGGS